LSLTILVDHRAVRRRNCVGGAAPVNFGRRRRVAGPRKRRVLSSTFSGLFSHRSKITTK